MTFEGLRGHAAIHAVLHNHKSNLDGWWIGGYVVVLHCGLGLQLPSLSNLGPPCPHDSTNRPRIFELRRQDFRALSSHAQFISPQRRKLMASRVSGWAAGRTSRASW